MAWLRLLPLFFLLHAGPAAASAPSGKEWLTLATPNFRLHHTPPLEPYARAIAVSLERALPEVERRLGWKAPAALDVIVTDPSDSANGLAVSFPNTYIELFASPFPVESPLSHYENWVNELAMHELAHIVANDTTLGAYSKLRSVFGSWVKPNGLQPLWLIEGLAVFQETSLSRGGRGRSPLLEALLREAVLEGKLNDPSYTSIDRFNDGPPWWPGGNTAYLLGYTIQAIPAKAKPNLPGLVSYENARTMIYSPDRTLRDVIGQDWGLVWANASGLLRERYGAPMGTALPCRLSSSGRGTGGHALSSDGWLYFSEESWHHGFHLARVRADAACPGAQVERIAAKRFNGPVQVAVSPSGGLVAYSAFDPGFETHFSDIFLWSERGGHDRLTKGQRARDPAFASEHELLFVRAEPDTSQSIVRHDLRNGAESALFRSKPFERVSGLFAREGRVLFSLHANNGHEKVVELVNGEARPLVETMHPTREFERNPFLAPDGSVYFAASYGHGPQRIYRLAPAARRPELALATRSGYADRPVLLADGKTLALLDYGLNGLDLARAALEEKPAAPEAPASDLHEFLTGETPPAAPPAEPPALPPSVPYHASETTGTGLLPQYWFPEIVAAQDGFLAGASTSGNDALNYHRYSAIAQYDSRATFPVFRAFYRNRSNPTAFHFEANQTNNYFSSFKYSNRNTLYSVEAIVPAWDAYLSFGTAYRQRHLFGVDSNNMLLYQNTSYARATKTPSAIAPNWGVVLSNYLAVYPSTNDESSFADLRPRASLFFPGFLASHSMSLALAAGISTNKLLASNYYLGGGPSPLDGAAFAVRGYPTDTLFGQRIATVNYAYTLPLWHPHRGLGTNPFFLRNLGLRLVADAGTATFLGVYSGTKLLYYEGGKLGDKRIYGYGGELLAQGTLFYHLPASLVGGVHYGTEKRHGGGVIYYVALDLGLARGGLREAASPHDSHRH